MELYDRYNVYYDLLRERLVEMGMKTEYSEVLSSWAHYIDSFM